MKITPLKFLPFSLLAISILLNPVVHGQNTKPKVALVLSGGGAKGFAHIPTLQLLDSLNIVPDLIVGNSMGSIVGGLYAMGYSGDEIISTAGKVDWKEVLGGTVQLENVSISEKSEFNRYLTEFNLEKGKIKSLIYVLSDQKLRELFNTLTFPVHNIKNFDELPIPFRALATDIVNGEEIILKDGSLTFAMRASMSIPGVFEPVPYGETLLVDGGVLNNFPVDVAKDWGADIIIGSDVGEGMVGVDKLNNLSNLLFQAGMLSSNLKHPKNQALCDILIDNAPHLTYSTGDFVHWNALYEQGREALKENRQALIELAKELESYDQRKKYIPKVTDSFLLDSITFKNISTPNMHLVSNILKMEVKGRYTLKDLNRGIDNVMGTTLFNRIDYELLDSDSDEGSNLIITGLEESHYTLKGSLHYNGYEGAGLVANYTGRNILGRASRSLVTLDIAEQPKFRVQQQMNFGQKANWWWRSELYGQSLNDKVFLNGEEADSFKSRYLRFDNQFNRNINSLTNSIGVGISFESSHIRPSADPALNPGIFDLEIYRYKFWEVYAQYYYNSLNTVLFPTRGRIFNIKLGREIANSLDFRQNNATINSPLDKTNGYTRFVANGVQNIWLNPYSTLRIGTTFAFIFNDKQAMDEASFRDNGYGAKYLIGGNLLNSRNNHFRFNGLKTNEIFASQLMRFHLDWQYNFYGSFYMTPHLDLASVGYGDFKDYMSTAFRPKGDWENFTETSALLSAGCTFSFSSLMGPIDFDLSWVNNIGKVRLFFGIGYTFP